MHIGWLAKEELQLINERQFSRRHIDKYIRKEVLEDPENSFLPKIQQGVELLKNWMEGDFFDTKAARIHQLKQLDLESLVTELIIGICYFQEETPYVNAIGQLASRIGFDDKRDSIQTVAEVIAVLCDTDLFNINKHHEKASLQIISNICFSQELTQYIAMSCYLPPLVCEPRKLENNLSTPYYTHDSDSLILGGAQNHHNGDICLDVLNSRNAVPLALNVEFLCNVEEEPTHDLNVLSEDTLRKYQAKGRVLSHWDMQDMIRKQKQNWQSYKQQSYYFYSLLVDQGNRFYIGNKVDKRGRIYNSGYHISPQGTAFKKAAVELANKEQVTGIPDKFKRK